MIERTTTATEAPPPPPPRRCRVRFSATDDDVLFTSTNKSSSCPSSSVTATYSNTPLHYMIDEEIQHQLWYQPYEVYEFKEEVRGLVLYGVAKSGNTDISGLERFQSERGRYKRECIRYVIHVHKLSQQKALKDSIEILGNAAVRSSEWASKVASDQGYYDYCSVYCCNNNNNNNNTSNNKRKMEDTTTTTTTTQSQQSSSSSSNSSSSCGRRRVRQRTTSVTQAAMA